MKQLKIFLLLSISEIVIVFALFLMSYYYLHLGWEVNGGILLSVCVILAFEFYVYYPHFKKPRIGREGMIGLTGRVIEELNPEGRIKIGGETWKAKALKNTITRGEEVIVVDMEGLKLLVRKINIG